MTSGQGDGDKDFSTEAENMAPAPRGRHTMRTALLVLFLMGLVAVIGAVAISIAQSHNVGRTDVALIEQIIAAESDATRRGDVESAVALFAEDATISNPRGESLKNVGLLPPNIPVRWVGVHEIRARYEGLLEFVDFDHFGVVVTMNWDGASAKASSGTKGAFVDSDGQKQEFYYNFGDTWQFRRVAGGWRITELACPSQWLQDK